MDRLCYNYFMNNNGLSAISHRVLYGTASVMAACEEDTLADLLERSADLARSAGLIPLDVKENEVPKLEIAGELSIEDFIELAAKLGSGVVHLQSVRISNDSVKYLTHPEGQSYDSFIHQEARMDNWISSLHVSFPHQGVLYVRTFATNWGYLYERALSRLEAFEQSAVIEAARTS